jgi:hypothetical protein
MMGGFLPTVAWSASTACATWSACAPSAAFAESGPVTLVVVGLAGVAAVSLVGSLVLRALRRRRSQPTGTIGEARAAASEELLDGRADRRRRARLSDDPILAALGVDDEMAARRARRRARQAEDDPAGSETASRG